MSNNTTAVTGTASADPFDDPVTSNKMAIRALIPLLITFVLGTLCLQGFNLVFQQVGGAQRGPIPAARRTGIATIVLGVVGGGLVIENRKNRGTRGIVVKMKAER